MRLLDQLRSSVGTPAAPLVGYPSLSYIGADVKDGITNAETQSAALLAYYDAIHPDVLFPFMDLSVEAEALGLPIRYNKDGGPDVTEHPVRSLSDLEAFAVPPDAATGRFGVFTETIRRLRAETKALVGGYVTSPFTLAGLLMSAEELAVKTLTEPEVCHSVLDATTRVSAHYAAAQVEAGAQFIVLLEPTATFLSPALYESFVGPYVERVIQELSVPVVLHVCGQTTNLIPSFIKNSVSGMSLDAEVDLTRVAEVVPESVAIFGNISPVAVMLNLGATEVYRAVQTLLRRMVGRRNFVASTGCDLPFAVNSDNLLAFCEAVRDFNAKEPRSD